MAPKKDVKAKAVAVKAVAAKPAKKEKKIKDPNAVRSTQIEDITCTVYATYLHHLFSLRLCVF